MVLQSAPASRRPHPRSSRHRPRAIWRFSLGLPGARNHPWSIGRPITRFIFSFPSFFSAPMEGKRTPSGPLARPQPGTPMEVRVFGSNQMSSKYLRHRPACGWRSGCELESSTLHRLGRKLEEVDRSGLDQELFTTILIIKNPGPPTIRSPFRTGREQ